MHKDIPVAEINMIGNMIHSVGIIINTKHMPVGTKTEYPALSSRLLSSWNEMRSIPRERQNIEQIERALGCTISEAKIKSLAVSLTDCYWLADEMNQFSWNDVNYHTNGFSSDLADLMWNKNMKVINYNLPDLTTDGALKKVWVSLDGIPTLIKFGDLGTNSNGNNLLSANEVVASKVAELMNIEHVLYVPIKIESRNEIACACDCFIKDTNHEFVNALQLLKDNKNTGGVSLYNIFKNMGMKKEVDRMIIFDHILHNTDRHEKNFGIIREAESLQVIKFAPIFDSGSCLGWNRENDNIDMNDMKPFSANRKNQLNMADIKSCSIPEKEMVKQIVQETYEQFKINESCYEIACEELDYSFGMLPDVQKIWPVHNIEDCER